MRTWRLLVQPGLPGYTQMAIDEALYLLADHGPPALRFYTWQRPTLSLGFFQRYRGIVSETFIRHNKIDVVRRITGGRAVLHDREVTYSLAAPLTDRFAGQTLKETYSVIAQALNHGLHSLGVDLTGYSSQQLAPAENRTAQCFLAISPYEISREARKIIGSAQKRGAGKFLQHGSILLDFDPHLQNGCILNSDPAIERKIAPLNRLLGREVTQEELIEHFAESFERHFSITLEPSEMTGAEKELAHSLETVYQSKDWIQNGCR